MASKASQRDIGSRRRVILIVLGQKYRYEVGAKYHVVLLPLVWGLEDGHALICWLLL